MEEESGGGGGGGGGFPLEEGVSHRSVGSGHLITQVQGNTSTDTIGTHLKHPDYQGVCISVVHTLM